jgi:hypothetical protein
MANRDKVITLRMNVNSFNIVQDYAKSRGFSVNSYLNSIIDSYAEWYIPLGSYEPVAVPKRLFSSLFNLASKEKLDELAHNWAKEAKNGTVLLFGTEFNLESALDFTRKISKYVMDSDARITTTADASQRVDKTDNNRNNISIVIRHDLGENFSFYYSRGFLYFFNLLQSVKTSVEYDESTITVKLDRSL